MPSNDMKLKKIAILGPGGNVGNAIIKELLIDASCFEITAITRETSNYTPPLNSNIIHKAVDYASASSLEKAFQGQDAVVNCITGGATHYDSSKLIVDATISAGVNFYFANEYVGHVMSEQFKRMPESAVGAKIRIRQYLEEVAKEGQLTWTSLNGGPFFDMWLMKGPAGFDIANRRARIYGDGNEPLLWTPLPTIALAAANMLRDPQAIQNRPIHICPFTKLTQNIILDALESILGTKFSVEHVDINKIHEHAMIALERGEVLKSMKGLTLSNQYYAGNGEASFGSLVENEVVGVQLASVEGAIKDAIAMYGEDCKIVEGMFKVEPCDI